MWNPFRRTPAPEPEAPALSPEDQERADLYHARQGWGV